MAATSKLSLLIDMSTKLYNSKLGQMHQSWKKKMDLMKANYGELMNKIPSIGNIFRRTMDSIPFAKYIFNPIVLMGAAMYKLNSYISEAVQGYKDVAAQESKLGQVMQNTMGATKEQFEGIKNFIGDQAKIGVVDAGTTTGGAQELATYLTEEKNLKKLIPVMNDMLAQQYGLNATQEQAINIGSMLGKVMDGQVGALSRYGYKFDETQAKILKTGTEAQRAAVLFDVVTSSVGGVNEALANTPEGKMKQMANRADLLKEKVGGMVVLFQTSFGDLKDKLLTFFEGLVAKIEENKDQIIAFLQDMADKISTAFDWLMAVIKPVIGFFVDWYTALRDGNPLISALTTVLAVLIGAIVTYQTVASVAKSVTEAWKVAQVALDVALAANPIGVIVTVIGALIALIVIAIKKYDEWGAALMLFMGPIGIVINAFKSIYDHWESIKNAFKTEGIIGGLKRLHVVLIDAVLKPLQQILEMIADFDPTGISQKALDRIKTFREANKLVTPGEITVKEEEKPKNLLDPEAAFTNFNKNKSGDGDGNKKLGDDVNKVTGDARQVKNITINIDSLNKGGINLSNSTQGMTKGEVEDWFNNMMMRIMRNAELS